MQSSAGLAQDRKFEYTFGGGISLLLTPNKVKDFYKTGFQGVVGFGFRIMSNLLIGGSVSYNNFGLDKTALLESVGIPSDSNIDVVGGTITLVEMLGVVKYYFWASEKSPNFYVLGGPGFSWGRISEVSVLIPNQGPFTQNSQTDTNFTLAGGLGVKFRVGKSTNLFIEGRYSVLISDGEDLTYVPLKFGVLF
jgi:opacity protein-like surface antigen